MKAPKDLGSTLLDAVTFCSVAFPRVFAVGVVVILAIYTVAGTE